MTVNVLTGYLSRSQIKEYLNYILQNGADSIVEAPDSVYSDSPMSMRVGSAINSIKQFHVERLADYKYQLTQQKCILIDDNTKPDAPEGAIMVGVFYMSKAGSDYTSEADMYGDRAVFGTIGDIAWVPADEWKYVTLSPALTGVGYRLIVFWTSV